MVKHHFKQIPYEYTAKEETISLPKDKVVIDYNDFHMMRDYIILLEGTLYCHTHKTFDTIKEELKQTFGEEKFNKMYGWKDI